ncbi:MAG: TRAP transporter substrate-binding protein [Rhodobacteraceae bacterium]|nr:TRAP transporter substrate-binding protein [Paracoccaceae bacterium]MBR9821028.1 TRAP transporter substrate-binding protein [Paracoccaceae bacterium]
MKISPRNWAAAAGLALMATGPAMAEELKVSTFVVADQSLLKAVEAWGAEIEKRSGGALSFVYFPSSQMGPPNRQFDLARTGVADIALFLHGFTPGRFPLTELTYLPGVFEGVTVEQGAAAMWALSQDYLAAEHPGTHLLAVTPTGSARIFSQARFDSIESLAGRRIRHPGAVIADTYAALGAVPVGVPPQEMADAAQRGIVDGLGVSFQAANDWKLEGISDHVLDVDFGVASFALVMNQARYDSLPEDLRSLIDETSGEALSRALGAATDASEDEDRARFAEISTIISPGADEMARFEQVFAARRDEGVAALEADGLPARAFFDRLESTLDSLRE